MSTGGHLNFNAPGDSITKECDTMKIPVNLSDGCDDTPDAPNGLRVLIAGRTGCGKSTLVSSVFGWTPRKAGVSHNNERTPLDHVWRGRRDEEKPGLILHDSGGFEAGGTAAVDQLLKFIDFRRKQTDKNEILHCIWYCISCSEKRLTHEAEVNFFKTVDVGNIPVVIVFTQFDFLVEKHKRKLRRQNLDNNRLDEIAFQYAVTDYDENYRREVENKFNLKSCHFVRVGIPDAEDADQDVPMNTLPAYGIDELLKATNNSLSNGALRSLLAYAQRYSADGKLQQSPEMGMQMFNRVQWTTAIPIIPFIGATGIYTAFCQILINVSKFWGIPGTSTLIQQSAARNLFFKAVFGVETWYGRLGIHLLHSIDIISIITHDITAGFVLRMIAAVTLVHERLFWINVENKGVEVTEGDVRKAVELFDSDKGKKRMLDTINSNTTFKGWNKTKCVKLLKEAIQIGKSPKYAELLAKHTISY